MSRTALTLGALGWGQIQIANAHSVEVREQSRASWMCSLCEAVLEFYPREAEKIRERIAHFERVSARWKERAEERHE